MKRKVVTPVACLAALLATSVLAAKPHHDRKPKTELVSAGTRGSEKNADGSTPSLSRNGWLIAFASGSQLTKRDHNDVSDVYVRDRKKGKTKLVSLGSDGQQGSDPAFPAGRNDAISANGRFVLFSSASRLTDDDEDDDEDIFLRDLTLGRTTLVNRTLAGDPGGGIGGYSPAALSSDGKMIAFGSFENYGESPPSAFGNIFVYDPRTEMTSLVSKNSMDDTANGTSGSPDVSDNGLVAFVSAATNLGIDDAHNPAGSSQLYVRDLNAGTTTPISVPTDGTFALKGSREPAITPSGRFIAFTSGADNLVPDDSNGRRDVFRYDLEKDKIELVSVSASGRVGDDLSDSPSICDNGRFVAFYSEAHNFVKHPAASRYGGAYVRDMKTGKIVLASVSRTGRSPNYVTGRGESLAGDCRTVAFDSEATNLIKGDNDGRSYDVYVRAPLTR